MPKYVAFPKVNLENREWPDKQINQAPAWCSVDLRDGNQALETPMSIATKIEYFDLLLRVGFKEIEVGFPSASQIDFDFQRRLIDENRIPDDVTIQILCQTRDHLIERSIESLKGVKRAVFHLYTSTSPVQRKITFGMSKQEILDIAVSAVRKLKEEMKKIPETEIILQYSPESFSNTEVDYALEICEAVKKEWDFASGDYVILNLPATVESSTPNIHADQIEWFRKNISTPEKVIISLHTHNDRGTGVAAAELGVLAGAGRVEGTLFGNGERTGNLDLVTMALNMYSQGVDPKLNFTDILKVREEYEQYTNMPIHPRHPYAGDLVFTAFSGSHQDAIKKGMTKQADKNADDLWEVPYLPIDPKDIGRSYEAIIRFNAQSGKGGAAFILEQEYGLELPKGMHPAVGKLLNDLADKTGKELKAAEMFDAFKDYYMGSAGELVLKEFQFLHPVESGKKGTAVIRVQYKGEDFEMNSSGTGPIDAFVTAIKEQNWKEFSLTSFHEHSIGGDAGSAMDAVAYTALTDPAGTKTWGCGIDNDISKAGIKSVVSAFNILK